ncbi:protein lin-9 homolog [Drosophila grimshawi]|uniref:GH11979 n=1 Tax=Drosophila grimshawi TaxID=7222 RepID=B4JKW3_DROGR|nr:protein lin-9 homolog [Drosophila grimshawi]EDW00216.1 GH11979 [Drosophila grimshawi]
MPETEKKSIGNRGRPRKSVAALRKIARESNADNEILESRTRAQPIGDKQSVGVKKNVQDQDEDEAVGKLMEHVLDDNDKNYNEGEVDDDEEEEPDSNEASEPEEQVEPPAFSLATLGLQRVGSAPPPKPKSQKPQMLLLNARGMPARIRKRNPLFYDENIINDDKPLRVSLTSKKPMTRGYNDSPGKMQTTLSKVIKKRKGVVSRYMRSNDGNGASTSQSTSGVDLELSSGKTKKLPPMSASASKAQQQQQQAQLRAAGRGTMSGTKRNTAGAAAAAAEDVARKAEANAVANKRLGLSIGQRLRNLLKLPKAHKWAIAEWFYSYIDKPLFDCKYEFMNHVSKLAPRLATRNLNRHEWAVIRRRMGRPRRCSAAFFDEERRELERKRQLMRTLQSRKPGEFKDSLLLSDMPDKIPMPLPLGTKVTARLRKPQDAIFAGTVAAYDSMNSEYRVTFERPGLSTQSIPDYEIVSENFHEMLPLHSFTKDYRPNLITIYQTSNSGYTTNLGFTTNLSSGFLGKRYPLAATAAGNLNSNQSMITPQKHLANNNAAARNALSMKLNKSDPLLGQDAIGESPIRQQLVRHLGYSTKLLEHLVLLQKYIALKESRIERLAEMNSSAELTAAGGGTNEHNRRQVRDNFQRRYASNIIWIERINMELMYLLTKVQELSGSLTRNPNIQAMISPTLLREECRARASRTVDKMNNGLIKSESMVNLLKNLTTLLIVTQNLDSDWEANEVNKVLEGCMEEVRSNLICAENVEVFQKCVQLPIEQIAVVINRNMKERTLNSSQDKSASQPKTPKSDAAETASIKSTTITAKSLDKYKKQQKKTNNAKEKSKLLVESDVEPMDVDSEPDDDAKTEQQKKHTDDDDEDVDADAEAEAEADADADAEDSDAREKHEDEAIVGKVYANTEDTQITIESMKESDDESQSHDEKDYDKPEGDMIEVMAAVDESDSQEEIM